MPRRDCAKDNCHGVALSGSPFCRWHAPKQEPPPKQKRGRLPKITSQPVIEPESGENLLDRLDRITRAEDRILRLLVCWGLICRRQLQDDPRVPKDVKFSARRALLDHYGYELPLMIEHLARYQQKTPADCWAEFLGDLIAFEEPTFEANPPMPSEPKSKPDDPFRGVEERNSVEPPKPEPPAKVRETFPLFTAPMIVRFEEAGLIQG